MTRAVGVDARQREGFWTVWLEDGRLDRIQQLDTLDEVLELDGDHDVLALDIPVGHEDPEGEGDGRRACDVAARELLGEHADRVFWMPPHAVYEVDHYHEALALCEDRGWPELEQPMWHARERVQHVTDASVDDDRIVEIHPEVSFTVLSDLHGDGGPLEHYGRGWSALYERLVLLHEVELRPSRSLGGVGRASPKDVIDATIAAWSAHRVATGQARRFPEDPPTDPRTGRTVAMHA